MGGVKRSLDATPSKRSRARSASEDAVALIGGPHAPAGGTPDIPRSNTDEPSKAQYSGPQLAKYSFVVAENGKLAEQLWRIPMENEVCVIDYVRLVLPEHFVRGVVGDEAFVSGASSILQPVFGYGVGEEIGRRDHCDFCRSLGGVNYGWGHFAWGGTTQRGTCLVSITAKGCLDAMPGWEFRLADLLDSVHGRITRIDLAHDMFDPLLTVDAVKQAWHDGEFDRYGNTPRLRLEGDWFLGDKYNKGRTVYVGTRNGSQLFRAYEKALQLGAAENDWLRLEVEFSNRTAILPIDMLRRPSEWFVAAYPFLREIGPNIEKSRLVTKLKSFEAGEEHYIRHCKVAYGKAIRTLRQLHGDEALLDKLQSATDEPPARLRLDSHTDFVAASLPVAQRSNQQDPTFHPHREASHPADIDLNQFIQSKGTHK